MSSDRPWQEGTPERIAARVARDSELVAHRLDRDGDDGAAGGRDARASRRSSSCAPCSPGFRSTGSSRCRMGGRTRTRCCRTTARWCGPSCSRSSGWRSAMPIAIGTRAVHHSRRHRARARPLAQRVQPRAARADRLRRSCRAPGCWRSAAASSRQMLLRVPEADDRRAHARAAGRAAAAVRARALVSGSRRSRSAKTSSAPKTI